jgi:hypothetical protein
MLGCGCFQPPQYSKTTSQRIAPPFPPRIRAADLREPLDYLSSEHVLRNRAGLSARVSTDFNRSLRNGRRLLHSGSKPPLPTCRTRIILRMWRHVVAVLRVIGVRNWLIPASTEFQNQPTTGRPAIHHKRFRETGLKEPLGYLST